MKIEKINENQIRYTLTKEDLEDRDIKLSKLDLPVELYFILNKLVTVKKLSFSLDSINQQRKEEILLILLNLLYNY